LFEPGNRFLPQARLAVEVLRPRHRDFLRSIKALTPDWTLLPVPHATALPSLRWRLLNLEKFRREQPDRYAQALDRLNRVLDEMG